MNFRLILASAMLLFIGNRANGQAYFQQHLDYNIIATLDTTDKTLKVDSKLLYTNNSKDKLDYIFFHVWWNAYSDKTTAFAEQRLKLGMKDFYFAKPEDLGGYTELRFEQAGKALVQETYLDASNRRLTDVVKVVLEKAIEPGESVEIAINASIKIPALFSRGGWQDDLFRFTQWYPKPAVYDQSGWHPMPYLDMGEYYSDYGNYNMTYIVPSSFEVMTTGEIVDERIEGAVKKVRVLASKVPDVAWFCSSTFGTKSTSIEIGGQKIPIHLFTNFPEDHRKILEYIEDALRFYSEEVGQYPYPQYSLVLSQNETKGGMEYPMISVVDMEHIGQPMDNLIAHEVGHNWFQSAIGTDERKYPWIDEGFNSFYERKYNEKKYVAPNYNWLLPKGLQPSPSEYSVMEAGVCHLLCCGKLSKINQASDEVDMITYGTNSYERMALSLKYLEAYLGKNDFKKSISYLYSNWLHKHPSPADLRKIFEEASEKELSWFFEDLLNSSKRFDYKITRVERKQETVEVSFINAGEFDLPFHLTAYNSVGKVVLSKWVEIKDQQEIISIPKGEYHRLSINGEIPFLDSNRRNNHYYPNKVLKAAPINFRFLGQQENSYNRTISFLPLPSYNKADGLMLGLEMHNQIFPYRKTRWHIQPAYGFKSGTLAGLFNIERDFLLNHPRFEKITLGLSGRQFGYRTNDLLKTSYRKLQPSLTLKFNKGFFSRKEVRYNLHYLPVRTFDSELIEFIPEGQIFIHQLNYESAGSRRLMKFQTLIQLEYESYENIIKEKHSYLKLSLERKMQLYYTEHSQLHFRFFGGYFITNSQRESASYTGAFTRGSIALTQQGYTDHTFEGYYFSRSEQSGLLSRQFLIEEGGFKMPVGSSYSFDLSNNYLLAANIQVDLPFSVLKTGRIRPFLDLGYLNRKSTLSQPLNNDFLFSSGISFEIGDFLGIYLPLFYSEAYKVPFQGTGLLEKLSFKIDLSQLGLWKLADNPAVLLK